MAYQLGSKIEVSSRLLRSDGLVDVQIFEVVITYIDDYRAEYRKERTLFSENVLREINRGGFSLVVPVRHIRAI